MDLADILKLHTSIKQMEEQRIIDILGHFTDSELKQLLMIYLQHFFNAHKRDLHLNQTDEAGEYANDLQSSIDLVIIKKLKTNIIKLKIEEKSTNTLTILNHTLNDIHHHIDNNKNNKHKKHKKAQSQQIITVNDLNQINSKITDIFNERDNDHPHRIQELPQIVISYIMSFMDHKARNISSKISHLFFQASTESIAKYHLLINSNVVNSKLIHPPSNVHLFKQYKSISWWSSYKFQTKTNPKWQNFTRNMQMLLTSESLQTLDIITLPVYRDCCEELEAIALSNHNIINLKILRHSHDINYLHRLRKLEVTRLDMEPLWINQQQQQQSDREPDGYYMHDREERMRERRNSRTMNKYFITKSNIRHLILNEHWFKQSEGTEFKSFFHPIYWLWNLPSLQKCELTMILSANCQFQQHFSKMLSSSAVKQVAKNQIAFTTLIINVKYMNHEDIGVFVEYLRVLYPNLRNLSIFLSKVSRPQSLDIKYSDVFNKLREIRLNLPTTGDGQKFLQEIIAFNDKFDDLEILHLSEMKPPTAISSEAYQYITQQINDLLLVVCHFIANRPHKLHSFGIDIMRWAQHQNLSVTYWKPILLLLESLLRNIKENNDIFDGYISLKIPFCGFLNQRNIRTDHDRHWWTGEYSWNEDNNQGSLNVAHMICELQTEIANRNKIHETDKKLILDLHKLVLRKKHDKFLKFWFSDDDELYDGRKFIMQ